MHSCLETLASEDRRSAKHSAKGGRLPSVVAVILAAAAAAATASATSWQVQWRVCLLLMSVRVEGVVTCGMDPDGQVTVQMPEESLKSLHSYWTCDS